MAVVNVIDVFPLCYVWTDQSIKMRLTAKIRSYGNYGYVDISS